jgi:hypothetical protein
VSTKFISFDLDSRVVMVMLDGTEVSQISSTDFILDPSKLRQFCKVFT